MRYEILSCDTDKLFSINSIGYSDDVAVTQFGPGRRDLYIIHYVISGSGFFNGQKISGGQGFLITPGMQEHYYSDKTDPWSFLWVIFGDSDAERLFKEYNADPQTHIFEYNNTHTIEKAVNSLFNNRHRYTSAELFEFYLNIFNNHNHMRQARRKSPDMYYDYAVNYIHLNLFRIITVEELTKVLGISQPYLYKVFTDKCGVSPKQYITSCKISKAKQLLRETDLSVCEVAASVGFSDSLNFSKQFKKLTGDSPKAFREL